MRLAVLQVDVVLADEQANISKVRRLLEGTKNHSPDVIVLPETWNLGFFPDNAWELAACPETSMSLNLLQSYAQRQRVNIVGGSLIIRDGKRLVNRTFIINRTGTVIATYDKIHLFSLGNEDKYFKSGSDLSIFEIDGINCSSIICYDLRFPELCRISSARGAEILFVPAHWPCPRLDHWSLLLRARAIENQSYVIGCNACGANKAMRFCGRSAVIGPMGELLAQAGMTEETLYVEIDIGRLREIRDQFPFTRDRQDALYATL